MTLLRLSADGADRAIGTAALVPNVAKAGHGGTYVDLVGEYRDEYVRTGGGGGFGAGTPQFSVAFEAEMDCSTGRPNGTRLVQAEGSWSSRAT
jgi:hypothetical protein